VRSRWPSVEAKAPQRESAPPRRPAPDEPLLQGRKAPDEQREVILEELGAVSPRPCASPHHDFAVDPAFGIRELVVSNRNRDPFMLAADQNLHASARIAAALGATERPQMPGRTRPPSGWDVHKPATLWFAPHPVMARATDSSVHTRSVARIVPSIATAWTTAIGDAGL
jgi:hypothetical protein